MMGGFGFKIRGIGEEIGKTAVSINCIYISVWKSQLFLRLVMITHTGLISLIRSIYFGVRSSKTRSIG